jgi:pimeloyl-ACP methyl ester carboxylesterase
MPEIAIGQQRIFYRVHGASTRADGRGIGRTSDIAQLPLILVHGAGGTLMNWPSELRRLPETGVYALDLPSHGRSQGPGLESISDYSDAVLGFADALELSEFVLVGHSMGSAIAMEMALSHPDRLAGLVLVGANARLKVAPALLDGLRDRYDETAAWLVKLLFGSEADPRLSVGYLQALSTLDRDVIHSDFSACDTFDRSEKIHAIRTPTLIICGAHDKMTPPTASCFLHEEIADSQLELIDNAGHMVMLEKPDEVASKIAGFLGKP